MEVFELRGMFTTDSNSKYTEHGQPDGLVSPGGH